MLRCRLPVAIECKHFFSYFRKEVAIDCLLQVPVGGGGGGGGGFEELEVVVKQEGVPEAADPSIAVLKRVNEFQFVVENAGADERIDFFVFKAKQEIVHEVADDDLFRAGNVGR